MGKAEIRKKSPFALMLAFVSLFVLFNFTGSSSFNLFGYGSYSYSGAQTLDYCPNGDRSPSYTDGKCDGPVATSSGVTLTGSGETTGSGQTTSSGETSASGGTDGQPPQPTVEELKPIVEVQKFVIKGKVKATRATSKKESLTLEGDGTLVIPENTLVAARLAWDGKIQAPTFLQNTASKKRGSVLIKAGGNTPLYFSKPVTISIPVTIADGKRVKVYYSSNGRTWKSISTVTVTDGTATFSTSVLGYFLISPIN